MMLEGVYGTRPDHLPRSMVRMALVERQGRRRPTWVGQAGVELLSLDQHLSYQRESLGRYPRRSDGTIEWNSVAEESVLCSTDSDSVDLTAVIQQYAPKGGSLVFLWGNMEIPSVKMASETTANHLPGIVTSMAEFWIYSPGDQVLLEQVFSGIVTVAQVPADPQDGSSA